MKCDRIVYVLGPVVVLFTCAVMPPPRSTDPPAGVGVALALDNEEAVVTAVAPDTPAARSKQLRKGDRILAVGQGEQEPVGTRGKTLSDVVAMVRGAEGTTVRLTVVPAGKPRADARVVTLVRGKLEALARWGDGQALAAGADAPNAGLVPIGGCGEAVVHLSDWRGQVVVLEFWATWCGPCQAAMADLQGQVDRHPNWKGKVVLATVSVNEIKADAAAHLKEKGWSRTQNLWADTEAIKAFHVGGVPTVYVLTKDGRVAAADHALDLATIIDRLSAE